MDWSKGQPVTALRSGGHPVIRSRSIGFHSSPPVLSRSSNSWGAVYVGKLPFPGGIGWWSKLGLKKYQKLQQL